MALAARVAVWDRVWAVGQAVLVVPVAHRTCAVAMISGGLHPTCVAVKDGVVVRMVSVDRPHAAVVRKAVADPEGRAVALAVPSQKGLLLLNRAM